MEKKEKSKGLSRVRINGLNQRLEDSIRAVAKGCLVWVGNRERGQKKKCNRPGMPEEVLLVQCTNPCGWTVGKGDEGLCSQLGNYMCNDIPEHSVWQPTAGGMKLLFCLVLLHLCIFY